MMDICQDSNHIRQIISGRPDWIVGPMGRHAVGEDNMTVTIRERLQETADRLGNREWLEDAFTAGDLMMVSVLRIIENDPLLNEHAPLIDYVRRATARPAFQRALASQLAGFTGSPPPGFAEWMERMKDVQGQSS
jgi:glutathione S-transferase